MRKQKGVTEQQLFVSKITANHGGSWKRFRADFIRPCNTNFETFLSHLTIELDLKNEITGENLWDKKFIH